ncbi:MAG: FHA domain-containing protein [bacterium]|nr:FHA domain-containing protein [bacterium]
MAKSLFDTLSLGMRYWFIAVIALMLIALISVSVAQLRERKSVMSEIQRYIGYLEIIAPEELGVGERVGLTKENSIGSSEMSDIIIRHPSVAKSHAVIAQKGKKLMLTSIGGGRTYINGRRVKSHTFEIVSGDCVGFGDVSCKVYIKDDSDEDED